MSLKSERANRSTTRTIGWSALAAVLALTSMPATTFAQDRDSRRIDGLQVQGQGQQNQNRSGGDNRGGGLRVTQSQPRSETRAPSASPQIAPRQVQQQQPTQNRNGAINRGDHRGAWQQRDVQRAEPIRNTDARRDGTVRGNDQRRDGTWRNNANQNREANRTSYDQRWENNQRNNGRRDNDWRNNDRRDNNWRNNDRRDNNWRNNDRRWSDRDNQRWDRNWRNNNRYDWRDYRTSNRNVYRPGRYYAPYRNYSYRRIGIGLTLGSLFYSNRYWISDPWQYRLPEVYGPYRWVRYYDDVLLVNTYTGEVVDVIYDFFW